MRPCSTASEAPSGAAASGPAPQPPSSERLLREAPFEVARRFDRRERWSEGAVVAGFLAVATAIVVLLPFERPISPGPTLALVLAYVAASRVSFKVGAGVAVPTQLVLVPMLLCLPAGAVPLAVAAALVISALPDLVTRRGGPERLHAAVGDAWHTIGPALVLALAGVTGPSWGDWPVYVAALAAQFVVDFGSSTAREWLGRGIAPVLQLRVFAWVYLIDSLLAPIGLLAAFAAGATPYAALGVLPLVALLDVFARDRSRRIHHALELSRRNEEAAIALAERVEELNRERARLELAIKRIGQACSSTLDRPGLLRVVMQSAADALSADCARVLGPDGTLEQGMEEQGRVGATEDFESLLVKVEASVLNGAPVAEAQSGEAWAVAVALDPAHGDRRNGGVISVARTRRAMSEVERDLLSYLATQAAAAIDNIALHELVQRQAAIDELTGLSNHRRLQEVLAAEVARSRHSGAPLALVMLDLDRFKTINDAHGHQAGDLVLRTVATAVAKNCRPGDEPARYGGEEIAVAMPHTDVEAAYRVAEQLREAIASLQIRLPGGERLTVTASFGLAVAPDVAADSFSLVAAADAALYDAKHTGRNRTVCATARALPADRAAQLVAPSG